MWLFTKLGFFSIVQKPTDKSDDMVTIRSRVREDLEALRTHYLASLGPTTQEGGSDYPYRARVKRAHFALALASLANDIDYSNFKSAVAQSQGRERARSCLRSGLANTVEAAERGEHLTIEP